LTPARFQKALYLSIFAGSFPYGALNMDILPLRALIITAYEFIL
jgi:hypothetical protein